MEIQKEGKRSKFSELIRSVIKYLNRGMCLRKTK